MKNLCTFSLLMGFAPLIFGALADEDYPFIARIENPQVNTLFLSEAQGQKVEVAPGTSYEWLVKKGQNWQAQYASGKFGTVVWNFNQSLEPEFAKCDAEFKRKAPNDRSLYVCQLEFARDPSRSGAFVGSAYMFIVKNVETLNIKRQNFLEIFSKFHKQMFPGESQDKSLFTQFSSALSKTPRKNASNLFDKFGESIVLLPVLQAQKPSFQHVLVLGDQGTGKQEAKNVARDMFAACSLTRCDYAISAGDNTYPHGPSIKDANWQKDFTDKFVDIYKSLWDRFGFPFFLTLGNHDIGIEDFFFGDWVYSWQTKYGPEHFATKRIPLMDAQIGFTNDKANPQKSSIKMWNMKDERYSELLEKNGIKTFIVSLDTNYFPGELLPTKTPYNKDQSDWLLKELHSDAAKKADWRIVFAHHPIYSAGRHGVNIGKLIGKNDYQAMLELRKELKDIFCANDVDFYVVGHDHHLELDLIPCDNSKQVTVQVLSGAASKSDVAKWHELTVSEKLFGPDAFSPSLVKEIEPFVWANGLTKQEIIDGKIVQKMYGFSFLELHKNHAVVEMVKSTDKGPRWLACWRFDKEGRHLVKGNMSMQCRNNWSSFFEQDDTSPLPKK